MVDRELLQEALSQTLAETRFAGLGRRVPGKVRDSYVSDGRRTIVVSDRISVFDVIVGTVPFKGQVLNGIAAHWFEVSGGVAPNHLLGVPDPCVSVVEECEVFPVEMVVRGYLTGSSPTSIWTHYARGERSYCGHRLPEGMSKHQRLQRPLITPTTKAPHGEHDELTTADELIAGGTVTGEQWEQLSTMCQQMFEFGSGRAAEQGLILVDTKYELGRRTDGTIVFVDEIHTPDSSRYWYSDGYEAAVSRGEDPRPLDKDFVRRHMTQRGFSGEGAPPALSDDFRIEAAQRYIEIFERITGRTFEPDVGAPAPRIRANLALAGGD